MPSARVRAATGGQTQSWTRDEVRAVDVDVEVGVVDRDLHGSCS